MSGGRSETVALGRVRFVDDLAGVLAEQGRVEEMRGRILEGDAYVVRSVIDAARARGIRDYLTQIGRHSLPNYHAIAPGCPNFHRLNRGDERAYVEGVFHQFSFFPWNQDLLDLFSLFRACYELKNRISLQPPGAFLSAEPDAGCTARISFQFYPRGCGRLNCHADPVDVHQLVVPSVMLSQKGTDFQAGGLFAEDDRGRKIDLDRELACGDALFFNAQAIHGVDVVDSGQPVDWLSFEGRWIALLAVNRLASNRAIGDSVDLGRLEVDLQ